MGTINEMWYKPVDIAIKTWAYNLFKTVEKSQRLPAKQIGGLLVPRVFALNLTAGLDL
jgi:hypothetical protein